MTTESNANQAEAIGIERCPVCQARLKGATSCARCGADLALLARVHDQAGQILRDALASYRLGDRDHTLECLDRIEVLDTTSTLQKPAEFLRDKVRRRPIVKTIAGTSDVDQDRALKTLIMECANQVYSVLGEGLALSAYDDCLSRELSLKGLSFKRDFPITVHYKGLNLRDCGRINHLVEAKVAIFLSPSSRELTTHERRFKNWIRLCGFASGLLIDFDAL